MVEVTSALTLLGLFALAALVRIATQHSEWVSYPVGLVSLGLGASVSGVTVPYGLSHDVIMFLFLPAILFHEAVQINYSEFKRNLTWIGLLVLVILPASVFLLGVLGWYLLDVPLLVTFLLGAIVFPTDPTAVLEHFRQLGAPERLATIVESERILNDAVSIALFTTLAGMVRQQERFDATLAGFLARTDFFRFVRRFAVAGGGGVLVGLVTGFVLYQVLERVGEQLAEFLLTVVLAYGSFLVAHHVGASGIIATVTAGIFLTGSSHERGYTCDSEVAITTEGERLVFLTEVWTIAAFVLNTAVYVFIGLELPLDRLLTHLEFVVTAFVLVVVVRALTVYPTITGINRIASEPITVEWQHVVVWSGIHTVIPIALVLSLSPAVPYREQLRTAVFGIATFGVLLQGELMPVLLEASGVVSDRSGSEPSHPG